ncbi:hypothetical protein QR680_015065 [Steinernema hermaphroditum]|uniref:Malic enzyme n=1 Tax=Steinernema hermaphroditum TaxID=289476 RepID=A0AA39ICG2_9BILA|nr:hypothetical protein QR680_015065 [Steinernema hermaphroditum]
MSSQSVWLTICTIGVFLSSYARAESGPRCVHTWVKTEPKEGANSTEFFEISRIREFFANKTELPFDEIRKNDAAFYTSTSSYCLYFKLADDMLSDDIYGNDLHSAFAPSGHIVFDFLSLQDLVDKFCEPEKQDTAGIAFAKQVNYTLIGGKRSQGYVKVKWYCCQNCSQTIEEIEARFLIHLFRVNFYPKSSNFDGGRAARKTRTSHLRERAVSPCYDIYGERIEIATPHYNTPTCPIYALFMPGNPDYEFNDRWINNRNGIQTMWNECLKMTEIMKDNTCFWDYEGINSPIELKCCCYKNLQECSYSLSNRRQYTRCFEFYGRIYANGNLGYNEGTDAYEGASSKRCYITLEFTPYWAFDGIIMRAGGAEGKDNHLKCLNEMEALNVSEHCIVIRDPPLCPFAKSYGLPKKFTYSCCCKDADLCNLAFARDLINGLMNVYYTIIQLPQGTDIKNKKGCVHYNLPNRDQEQLALIEYHNFYIVDFVEFGKYSNCSLLEIKLFNDSLKNIWNECSEQHTDLNLAHIVNTPLFILRCSCDSKARCESKNLIDENSMDTGSPCWTSDTVSEYEFIPESNLARVYGEPAYCYVSAETDENGSIYKTYGAVNQTMLISNRFHLEDAIQNEVFDQNCQMTNVEGNTETLCSCVSKQHVACNKKALVFKAINMQYGLHRIEDSSDDESLKCDIAGRQREPCHAPGCFLSKQRMEDGTYTGKTGCIHRSGRYTDLDLYPRRLCLMLKMKDDCQIINPTDGEHIGVHVLCCCVGKECRSTAFRKKLRAKMIVVEDLMKAANGSLDRSEAVMIGRSSALLRPPLRRTFASFKSSSPTSGTRDDLQNLYRREHVAPTQRGVDLLKNPQLNKGMAFSLHERQQLGVHGLLPPAFMTEEQQAYRVLALLRKQPNDLARYVVMDNLHSRNMKLFYRVLCDNIKELMPIVYTPTVGQACQEYGFIYRNPKGVYITINDNSISQIYQILSNWPSQDVRAIVVTDGERILGLGDLGAYGIGIPVGKLQLYVALAGVPSEWCLPVIIDVGTDNDALLNDPFYIGLRHRRVRGPEYDTLIDNFMKACTKKYGQKTLIQFEDFGNQNAYRLLDRYKEKYCMFNDDIQGTASVVVAGLLACTRVTKKKLSQKKLVFYGAGGAATGIAEMCVRHMQNEGATFEEACSCIYMMDIDGLLTTNRAKSLNERHQHFAKDMPDTKDLLEVINEVKPDGIIGASTVRGAFTPKIIETMAKINQQPIIFALSNPTTKAECTAEDAYRLTDGRVLFASGSPFSNVELNGRLYKPGQGNNAYIFPGVALGVILFHVKHIDNKLFLLAAKRVAESVTEKNLKDGRIYPRLKEINEISVKIAAEIARECYKDGTAMLYPEPEDKEAYIRGQMFSVEYDELVNKTYDWPDEDMKHGFPIPRVRRVSMDD